MGKSLNENLLNEGVLALSGKSLIMAFIFRWASFNEISTLAFVFKVIDTVDKLS
jgi:hypothetical protein